MKTQEVPPPVFEWLQQRTGCLLTPDFRAIAAVDSKGRIAGMVGYSCWTENSVQCHMAAATPLAWRALLPAAFEYPFIRGGRGVLLGLISADNTRSVRMTRRLGFRETHRIRDGHARGVDVIVFELRREECRWLQAHQEAA